MKFWMNVKLDGYDVFFQRHWLINGFDFNYYRAKVLDKGNMP